MTRWVGRGLVAGIRGYRLVLSPWLGNACRFTPTCSVYAIEAIEQRGALAGSALAAGRIARCQPWCEGGHDPVPPRSQALFTSLLRRRRAVNPPDIVSP